MAEVRLTQAGYADLGAEAEERREQRDYNRRRLLAAVRGWLRENSSPRLATAGLFACAVLAASLPVYVLLHAGISASLSGMTGVLVTWPLFLVLLRWHAGRIFHGIHQGDPLHLIRADESACAMENQPAAPDSARAQFWEGVRNGAHGGHGSGGGGIFVLPILIGVTLGTWLIWELIRLGPTLLADTIIDAVMPGRGTALRNVTTYPWRENAFATTAPHFVGLAIAAWVVIATVALMLDVKH